LENFREKSPNFLFQNIFKPKTLLGLNPLLITKQKYF